MQKISIELIINSPTTSFWANNIQTTSNITNMLAAIVRPTIIYDEM